MTEETLFAAVLEQPAADRPRFLKEACGADAALLQRLQALLAAHEKAVGILDQSDRPPGPPEVTGDYVAAAAPGSERPGTVVADRYKLLQKIGEGGFGVVYMAEQEHPVRRMVALKVIKPGMDTAQVIARFESERQALALMEHPNIAKVLDAGATDSGRPYFVMELVKGVPVTEFCDQNHMPPEARLKLFINVCQAIQHAHHKGVIHRDVKPSNVLVTLHDGVPMVKVIDFGVAKAAGQKLTEKTLFTAYGQMIGTPAYMSPEQAEMSGLDIDTRSDVYSLGVLLYELLTGTTPLEGKRLREAGYEEMQRLIREKEAPRPSNRLSSLGDSATVLAGNRGLDVKRLVRLLAGELDWVVMKALDKDRRRRYDTPGHFAEDVERYLRREAILARPPSAMYKLKKFAQRNSVQLLTAFVLWVAIMVAFQVLMRAVVGPWILERQTPPGWLEDSKKMRDDLVALTKAKEAAETREAETWAVLDLVSDALGSNLLQQNKWADAETVLRECLPFREKQEPDAWTTFHARSMLGGALLGQKKYADAEPLLLAGYEGMKQREATIPAQSKVRLTEALERLVLLHETTGKKDEAAKWRKELEARKGVANKPTP